jgi:glycogen debranching enzyme
MADVIKVEDKYYILATATRAMGPHAVLKDGDTFAVFDSVGDVFGVGLGEQGLYHDGTRYLSMLELRVNSDRPLLLSSRSSPDNLQFGADLTNRDYFLDGQVVLPKDLVHVFRARFLWNGSMHERVRLTNYGRQPVRVTLGYEFDADFADIFEVRGTQRADRGIRLPWKRLDRGAELAYRGLDDLVRRTRLEWDVEPSALSSSTARFDVSLGPHETSALELTVRCETGSAAPAIATYEDALEHLTTRERLASRQYPILETSHAQLNNWLERSISDVRMMITDTPSGPYPYAGVPWFNTAFGRDGIVTALQLLWMNPRIAAGVLRYLASTQAQETIPERDAEPGKILHEIRGGEMAALGEVPFGRYYGSVDSTPLFVLLAGAYYQRTGNRALIDEIWDNIERAVGWIDRYGDLDGDGFVEYARRTPQGLVQQGWKDSQDSVFHDNGELADAPIALAEVQAYVYGARLGVSALARARGDTRRAETLAQQAEQLRERFEDAFWSDRLQTYALALDGDKRQCAVRSSNAGQCLLTGIARPDRARKVAEGLLDQGMFSGWGIRTIDAGEVRYNPMSYHNGSVWPHDNALIAAGFARYGFADLIQPVFTGHLDASGFFESCRLPELFCGFHRRRGEGPTIYPVACSPQAWAAGSVFLMLQSALGLQLNGLESRITVSNPRLPDCVERVIIRDLALAADRRMDLLFERRGQAIHVDLLRRQGEIELVAEPAQPV